MLSRQNETGVEASVSFFMLVLLAESKTMSLEQENISHEDYVQNKAALESVADIIMKRMADMPVNEIATTLGISLPLAGKAHSFAYDFPFKNTGYTALKGFTGEAYRALDVKTMTSTGISNSYDNLCIISSIYGLLRSSDIIKPYRCEFNKGIGPQNQTSIQLFKGKNTVELVKKIKNEKITEIISLLPADADKCIDWKIIRAFADVQKVVFQTFDESKGKYKTPIAGRLKELRGLMCREIMENSIRNFNDLTQFKSDNFIYSPEDSKKGLPLFIA